MIKFPILLAVWLEVTMCVYSGTMNSYDVFRAMQDEMQRSLSELTLGNLERPYFIEYTVTVNRSVTAQAVLGHITAADSIHLATVSVRIRVGSYELDNTNFFDVGLGFFGSSDDEESYKNRRLPVESNYSNLRRNLWLASDACYKQAVEIYAKKLATIRNRTRTDTTPDFSPMPSATYTDIRLLGVGTTKAIAQDLVCRASDVFRVYPDIQNSKAGFEFVPVETFYLNSEGRRLHKVEAFAGFEMTVVGQASDGLPVCETYAAFSKTPSELPSIDSLRKAATILAESLKATINAPTIETYSGPLLFEGQAAAELFAQSFAPNLVAQRTPTSDVGFSTGDRSMAFQNKIGGRVLPEFLSVRALPNLPSYAGVPIAAHYMYDDEGVPAETVEVVQNGYLKSMLTSRIPTRRLRTSNGHQRGGGAMLSTLQVVADTTNSLDDATLKNRMLKLVRDRDLPYGIIVRSVLNPNLFYTGVVPLLGSDVLLTGMGEGRIGITEAYRLYPDGREERIRGVQGAGFSPSSFKDIIAVSKNSYVHNFLSQAVVSPFYTGGQQYIISAVIAPAFLFEDGEVRAIEGDLPKPPYLRSPLAKD